MGPPAPHYDQAAELRKSPWRVVSVSPKAQLKPGVMGKMLPGFAAYKLCPDQPIVKKNDLLTPRCMQHGFD